MMNFLRNHRATGITVSIVLSLLVYFGTLSSDLAPDARAALIAILFTVTWWAFRVIPPAYTALLLLLFLVASGVTGPQESFAFWSGPMAWLMIGAFLIARGVTRSGLAGRISLNLVSRVAGSYRGLIIAIYGLNLVLAPLIPLPFPRAFLIMALVQQIINHSDVDDRTQASLGFAVFMGSVPASMMLLTAEAVLNPVTASLAGGISWMEWAALMAVPSLLAAALMLLAHLIVFPGARISVDTEHLAQKIRDLGPLSPQEIRVILWVGAALLLWTTDSLHQVHPAWVALGAALAMAVPVAGDILDEKDLASGVDWSTLIFATGALAIGAAGEVTGLSEWIMTRLVPASLPSSAPIILGFVAAVGYILHLFVGSVLAALSILVPPLVALAARFGVPSFAPALIIYTTAVMGIALPFHNLMILVGVGKVGHFTERETLRFFPAQTLVTLLVVAFQIGWWMLLGRL